MTREARCEGPMASRAETRGSAKQIFGYISQYRLLFRKNFRAKESALRAAAQGGVPLSGFASCFATLTSLSVSLSLSSFHSLGCLVSR